MNGITILDFIARQVFSGRWIMTVTAAMILWHVSNISPDKTDKIIDICKDIVIFYFVVKNTVDTLTKPGEKNATTITSPTDTTINVDIGKSGQSGINTGNPS